ncbi:arylsulfatase [Owenweeksia hongkongensis]|uniref:arylsulfatase n=1 Tax=Owenweeksia hongkongensis TaxID=253245 RepID=UPI003A8FDC35
MKHIFHTLLFFAFCASQILAQPNIILIVADDMGYSDLGCFGSEIETPNLDKLAQEGIRMRQFYNSAKCEPSRAMIISGQHWHDSGIQLENGPTIAEVIRRANYNTYAVGKWHLSGNPVDRGFDHFLGHLNGATNYFKGDPSFRLDHDKFEVPDNFYATSAYGDYAVKFIEEGHKANPEKRFFMYLAHTAPHAPLMALPEDIERFKNTYKAGWDKIREERVKRQLKLGIIDAKWPVPDRPSTIPAWKDLSPKEQEIEADRMATYAAMIYRMDASVGRVIDKLEALGIRDNTLIVFISDNGANPFDRGRKDVPGALGENHNYGLGWAFASNTPYRLYKQNQHNGGACTSAILNWPDVIPPTEKVNDTPVQILDLAPTFFELACAKYPAALDEKPLPGRSLYPLLTGKKMPPSPPMYFHLYDNAAIIDNNWKLVKAFGNAWELYNLNTDRAETQNLILKEPKKAQKLQQEWENWMGNSQLKHVDNEPKYVPLQND